MPAPTPSDLPGANTHTFGPARCQHPRLRGQGEGVRTSVHDSNPLDLRIQNKREERVAQLLELGSWVGVRRLFHLSLFLTASRMALPQDPSRRRVGEKPSAIAAAHIPQILVLRRGIHIARVTAFLLLTQEQKRGGWVMNRTRFVGGTTNRVLF